MYFNCSVFVVLLYILFDSIVLLMTICTLCLLLYYDSEVSYDLCLIDTLIFIWECIYQFYICVYMRVFCVCAGISRMILHCESYFGYTCICADRVIVCLKSLNEYWCLLWLYYDTITIQWLCAIVCWQCSHFIVVLIQISRLENICYIALIIDKGN